MVGLVSLLGATTVAAQSASDAPRARIGVLAYRGADVALHQWTPLAEYLGGTIDGWQFEIVPVTLVSAREKLRAKQIDFLITNPGHYVALSHQFDLSVLATRERRNNGVALMQFGAVIFCRANSGITSLDELKGKRLAAVSPDAFGGFQLAWHEFSQVNMDPFKDLESVRFMGFPHDAIVTAVQNGDVDAGVVRAGLLESLAAENRIELSQFRVLNNDTQPGYPFQVTGGLYPEWPFIALAGIDKRLREQVALALLSTQALEPARAQQLGDLWSAPLSYRPVRELVEKYSMLDAPRERALSNLALALVGAVFTLALLIALSFWRWARPTPLAAAPPPPAEPDPDTMADPEMLARLQSLTRREREVLGRICDGQSSRAIADELGISPKTVEYHRANLLQKTHAKSSAHLVQLVTRSERDLGFSLGDPANKHT